MASKEQQLLLKQPQLTVTGQYQKDSCNKFFELNLNRGHNCLSDVPIAHSFSKTNIHKHFGFTVTDNGHERGNSWNKSAATKDLSFKTLKNQSFNVETKEPAQKRWINAKNNSNSSNGSSTLSIHIAAYENFVEASANEDFPMKSKALKFSNSSPGYQAYQDPFEFPRQMNGNDRIKPQVQQFKASQRLFSPSRGAAASSSNIQRPPAAAPISSSPSNMGDEIALKIFDVIERKYKLSDLTDKNEIFTTLTECKENQKSAANINSDIINNSSFLKNIASISSSKSVLFKEDNDATPLATHNGVIPQDPPSRPQTPTFLIQPIEESEHLKVPDYMRRYLNVSDLNNMVLSLEKAFKNRIKLQRTNFHKLSKAEKDIRLAMRDETLGLKLPPETQFVSEEEWRKCLDTRMLAKLKWAAQQLRHLKRIKETRFRQKIYYILL